MNKNSTRFAPAVVVEVYDADSFHAVADLGWRISHKVMVRVEGINAPELNTPEGKAARDFARQVLKPGDAITIESRRLDKYGRTQAVVTLENGRDYAGVVLAAGHAVLMKGYGVKQ